MLFLRTERELVNEIMRKRDSGYVDYAEVAALERVQKILQNMMDESWEYVPAMIEKIFYHSDKDASGYSNARVLTVAQTAVVQQLSNNLLGELTEAAEGAKKSMEQYFTIARLESDPFREEVLKQALRQQAAGSPWIKGSAQMARELQNKGIPAFVDKAGRTWSLQAYGNMAVRTTARQAEVAAILTADEHDLWQIVKIGSTCPVCAALEGRVYSKSGMNPDYPPLSLAFGKVDSSGPDDLMNTYLNIHPNCLHSLIKYTTIGKTEKQIKRDKDFSDPNKNPLNRDPRTKKQIAAYREKEKNRRRLLADIRRRKGLKIEKIKESGLKSAGNSGVIPEHPKPQFIEKIDSSDRFGVQSTLEKYEKIIMKEPVENAVVITKTGEVIRCFGNKNSVYPGSDLGDSLKGAYVTHNHPAGSDNEYSFSNADVQLFHDYQLQVLRGIDECYVYELSRETTEVDEHVSLAELMLSDGDLARHEALIDIAKAQGLGYRRWKR